ncbi:MAG: amidohydrolase family protein, partial [Burkholderiaceae bacterium]
AMQRLAACDNAAVKISGLGLTNPPHWSAAENETPILRTIDWFGIDRCMFASNFPVDGLCTDFATLLNGFRGIAARFGAGEQRRLFETNAIDIYALPIDTALPIDAALPMDHEPRRPR